MNTSSEETVGVQDYSTAIEAHLANSGGLF